MLAPDAGVRIHPGETTAIVVQVTDAHGDPVDGVDVYFLHLNPERLEYPDDEDGAFVKKTTGALQNDGVTLAGAAKVNVRAKADAILGDTLVAAGLVDWAPTASADAGERQLPVASLRISVTADPSTLKLEPWPGGELSLASGDEKVIAIQVKDARGRGVNGIAVFLDPTFASGVTWGGDDDGTSKRFVLTTSSATVDGLQADGVASARVHASAPASGSTSRIWYGLAVEGGASDAGVDPSARVGDIVIRVEGP